MLEVLDVADDRLLSRARADELAALFRLTDNLYRARTTSQVYEAALDAIIATLGCRRASVLLFDDAGVMSFVAWRGLSDGYRAAVNGHSPWKQGERDPQPIFVSDIEETDEPAWIKDVIARENVTGLAFIPLVAQGGVIGKFMTYYDDRHDFDGHEIELAVAIARQLGFSIERMRAEEARKTAEAELRASEERFRLMVEEAPVMIWISDRVGRCVHLNSRLRTFWGVSKERVADFDWSGTLHPEDAGEVRRQIEGAIARQASATMRGRYKNAAGEYRILETDARPYFSEKAEFRGMIGVNVDITDRTQADEHRDLLLEELNHRVKNTLAVVQGIAYQTFKGTDAAGQARNAFEGRLLALAAAHSILTQSRWESASLGRLAKNALQAVGASGERVSLSGPMVLLRPKEALAMAMALHELCTNAVKYGALSNDAGAISVEWTVDEGSEPRLRLRWRERGGPRVEAPKRRGFGSRLIEQTIRQDLDGQVSLEFDPAGLMCSIDATLGRRDRLA
jgi:PAS domain S-box-containing protein